MPKAISQVNWRENLVTIAFTVDSESTVQLKPISFSLADIDLLSFVPGCLLTINSESAPRLAFNIAFRIRGPPVQTHGAVTALLSDPGCAVVLVPYIWAEVKGRTLDSHSFILLSGGRDD